MAYRTFTIPVRHSAPAEAEVNGFLRSHKVLNVDRRWVDAGENSFVPAGENAFWAACVDCCTHATGVTAKAAASMAGRVDYKEVLSAEDFRVFARLRELRKNEPETKRVVSAARLWCAWLDTALTSTGLHEQSPNDVRGKTDARLHALGT